MSRPVPRLPLVLVRVLVLVLVLPLAACRSSHAPYDLPVMRAQLAAAGYAVTPAPVPDNLADLPKHPGVVDVTCVDATKARRAVGVP